MDRANLLNEIRTAFWSVSSDVPVALQRTMQDLYAGSLARTSRLMSSLLFGIKSTEPGTYVAALGIIVAAPAFSSYLQARPYART